MQLNRKIFSLSRLIEEVVSLFTPSARQNQRALTTAILTGADHYWGDPLCLREILSNLTRAALAFAPEGTIHLAAEPCSNTSGLRFSVTVVPSRVAADQAATRLEALWQIDGAITSLPASDPGLATAKRLIALMGGKAGGPPVTGEGHCLWFEVPVEAADPGPHEALASIPTDEALLSEPPPQERTDAHILVVEDTSANLLLIKALLTRNGYRVTDVGDGTQAVAALCQEGLRPDAILMDCHMPVMDGLEATRRIRAWEHMQGRRRLPIIALTAGTLDEERAQCLAVGMDDFLPKPIDIALLLPMLERWLKAPLTSLAPPKFAPIRPPAETLDWAEALDRLEGDAEMLALYADLVHRQIAEDRLTLRETLTQNDCARFQKTCHKLKGSLAGLCAHRAAQLCVQLETRVVGVHREELPALLDGLNTELDAVIREVERYLGDRLKGMPHPRSMV